MRVGGYLILLFVAPLLAGCVGDKAEYVHSVWRGPDAAAVERRVYYVTDREPDKDWPGGFGKHWADRPSCGAAVVSIPAAGLPGEPYPNGKLVGATPAVCDTFADTLAAEAKTKGCNAVLIYIHGFNTLFDGGALRAGQLALDTRWDCPALVFSWSSEGEVGRYIADIEHSAYAVPEVVGLLQRLNARGLELDVVAHSIGARIALSALSLMARHGQTANVVKELILAAPDIGADPQNNDFLHLVADARPLSGRITVYASTQDAVLAVSAVAHGNVPRAGHRPKGDRALEDETSPHAPLGAILDVIDASDAPAEALGHSYFGLSQEAVSDMAQVLRGVPAGQRPTLVQQPDVKPHYVLSVAPERRPDWWTRLLRRLAPLIPRLELAPLTGSPE